MSEWIEGLPPPPPPPKPRDAAVVVLTRGEGPSVELFWVLREGSTQFGGFYAFPGGRLEKEDAAVPVAGAVSPELRPFIVAAARELFEETGVLPVRGTLPPRDRLDAFRQALLEKQQGFADQLKLAGLSLEGGDFLEAGRWITPEVWPARFDARFFWVAAPAGTEIRTLSGELAKGEWIRPAEALHRWKVGAALLHPPAHHIISCFLRSGTQDERTRWLKNPPHQKAHVSSRFEFQGGIRTVPLKTFTLPPATHTNAYVLGHRELLIVDPGAAEPLALRPLLDRVEELRGEGGVPKAVLLTHHHGDHVAGAEATAKALNLPVWCHPRTADRLPFKVDRLLHGGETLVLAGEPELAFDVLHTPGHAQGHLCLVERATRAAVVGDMIAGSGTILIDPPEGNMGDYVEQLHRLRDLPVGVIYPAHGPPLADGRKKLEQYIAHRAQREARVLDAVRAKPGPLAAIAEAAYAELGAFASGPLAERSTLAVLLELERQGRVLREGELYRPAK